MKKILLVNKETALGHNDELLGFAEENVVIFEKYNVQNPCQLIISKEDNKSDFNMCVTLCLEQDGIYVIFDEKELLNLDLNVINFGFSGKVIDCITENSKRYISRYSIDLIAISLCSYEQSIAKALLDQEIESIIFDENSKN
jgi:hypothetical protein